MKSRFKNFSKNIFTSKPVVFYWKGIEEMPDDWQEVIPNNDEYIIQWNLILIFVE